MAKRSKNYRRIKREREKRMKEHNILMNILPLPLSRSLNLSLSLSRVFPLGGSRKRKQTLFKARNSEEKYGSRVFLIRKMERNRERERERRGEYRKYGCADDHEVLK